MRGLANPISPTFLPKNFPGAGLQRVPRDLDHHRVLRETRYGNTVSVGFGMHVNMYLGISVCISQSLAVTQLPPSLCGFRVQARGQHSGHRPAYFTCKKNISGRLLGLLGLSCHLLVQVQVRCVLWFNSRGMEVTICAVYFTPLTFSGCQSRSGR